MAEGDDLTCCDAIAANFGRVYEQEFLRDLGHDVVLSINRSLKVNWTASYRQSVKAAGREPVKSVRRKRGVKAADFGGVSAAM